MRKLCIRYEKQAVWALLLAAACGPPRPTASVRAESSNGQATELQPASRVSKTPRRHAPLPRIVTRNGRHALFVDDAPYWMLCAQTNNSSNYPAALPAVWKKVSALRANTLQIPIAWEQVEPTEGEYDFSFFDTLLTQARERGVRLVPLWFGAFKNTSPSYAPAWVKLDNERFPRMVRPDGDNHYALSPHGPALLEAEKRAFSAFVEHIRETDADHTVIMLQVENEVGVYGLVRDHSARAQQLFEAPVPSKITQTLGKAPGPWAEAFGTDAEEFFTAFGFASYVETLAAAGKNVLDLPMYTNAALRHPTRPQEPGQYATGGPTHNVLDLWKAAAPSLDLLTPDIYLPASEDYRAVLIHYARADNPLFVSETGSKSSYPRYFFEAWGSGAIGFSPFGIDDDDYVSHPDGVSRVQNDAVDEFAANYELIAPAASEWARLAFEKGVAGVARPDKSEDRMLDLGDFRAEVSFDEWPFGYRAWSPPDAPGLKEASEFENSGVLVARIDDTTFLVTGRNARIEFRTTPERAPGRTALIAEAREVEFREGLWEFVRRWNGDQTDYGLNFTELPLTFHVTLGTYPASNESRSKPIAESPGSPSE